MTNEPNADSTTTPIEDKPTLVNPSLGHLLVVAVVAGGFAIVWLIIYSQVNKLIWDNAFVASNRWTIPVGVVFFSLLVGLGQKYLRAPNMIAGGIEHYLKAGDVTLYKRFWGTLYSSLTSLWSGVSVGPEAPLGFLAVEVSQWIAARLNFVKRGALVASLAGMSSAYNGIIGDPIFAALLAVEASGPQGGLAVLTPALVAGTIGFLMFSLAGIPPFAGLLSVGTVPAITLEWVVWAIALGAVGVLVALYIRGAFDLFGRLMGRFGERIILRVLVAGVIIGVVCYFVPDLMCSGEHVIQSIIDSAAQYGAPLLLLMALVKPLLLALSIKSGYLGGPIFPALFTSIMVGLAIGQLAPSLPLAMVVTCPAVAVLTLVLRAPLTSILLIALLTSAGASQSTLGLVAVSAATALLAGMLLQQRAGKRNPQPQTQAP